MEDVLQATVDGLTTGSIIAIAAVGLTLVYGILRLTNFAHGDFLTFGAYAAYTVSVILDLPLALGILTAVVATAALALTTEFVIWRPMRRSRAGLLQMLLMSIGLALFIRYMVQFVYGGRLRRFDIDVFSTNDFGIVRVSTLQLTIIGLAAIVLTLVGLLLSKTMLGTSMRAVSDNAELAESSGVNTDRVIIATWLLAGALAGFGGVLAAMSITVTPTVGWNLLLTLFAAVILGGIGNAYGALLGGYAIGFAQEFSGFVVDTRYKTVVGFVILIVVLLVRPQGILGRRRAVN